MPTIIIYPTRKDGFGDIAMMVNIANVLANYTLIQYRVIMVSNDKNLIIEKFDTRKFLILTLEQAKKLIQSKGLIPSLFVVGPTFVRGHSIQQGSDSNIPTLWVGEYSNNETLGRNGQASVVDYVNCALKNNQSASVLLPGLANEKDSKGRYYDKVCLKKQLELRSSEDGVFIEQKLCDRGLAFLNDRTSYIINAIQELSPQIRTTISQFLVDDIYFHNNKNYFYYGHQANTYNSFIKFIIAINGSNNNDINLFATGKPVSSELDPSTINCLREYEYDFNNKSSRADGKKRKINLIYLDSLPHSDFIVLMSISDGFTAITGDQSFTEAINLHKIPFYDLRGHKRFFYTGFLQLINNLGLKNLSKTLHLIYLKQGLTMNPALLDGNIDSLTAILTPELIEQCTFEMRQFVSELNREWNLNNILIDRVNNFAAVHQQPFNQLFVSRLVAQIQKLTVDTKTNTPFLSINHRTQQLVQLYCLMANKLQQSDVLPSAIIHDYYKRGGKKTPFIEELLILEANAFKSIEFLTNESELARYHG